MFHIDANTKNKLLWVDPDRNALHVRIYDVGIKFYCPDLILYVIKGSVDARATGGMLDIEFVLQDTYNATTNRVGPTI